MIKIMLLFETFKKKNVRHKIIVWLTVFSLTLFALAIPNANAVTVSSNLNASGTIVYLIPGNLSLKWSTGFESATATSTTLNGIGISNYIAIEGTGTASIWIETGSQITPHSGTRALGMQAGNGDYRCELDLLQNALGCSNSDAIYVDEWIYLPSTFTVTNSPYGGYYDLFQFEGQYSSGCYPIFSFMIGTQNSDGTFPIILYGRDYTGAQMGNEGVLQEMYSHFNLPRGQWFHFQWYNTISTSGIIQAWINGQQVINATNINTTTHGTQWYINTDIYFNHDDLTTHKMWIDDITVYG
jgi:hypothetical protein